MVLIERRPARPSDTDRAAPEESGGAPINYSDVGSGDLVPYGLRRPEVSMRGAVARCSRRQLSAVHPVAHPPRRPTAAARRAPEPHGEAPPPTTARNRSCKTRYRFPLPRYDSNLRVTRCWQTIPDRNDALAMMWWEVSHVVRNRDTGVHDGGGNGSVQYRLDA